MLLPRVLSDIFIYCCEYGNIKHDYRQRQTHRQKSQRANRRDEIAFCVTE